MFDKLFSSGEEGYYPKLTQCAEDRLFVLKPNDVLLRKSEPPVALSNLEIDEQKTIKDDIENWLRDMKVREKDLGDEKTLISKTPIPRPEVRVVKEEEVVKNWFDLFCHFLSRGF